MASRRARAASSSASCLATSAAAWARIWERSRRSVAFALSCSWVLVVVLVSGLRGKTHDVHLEQIERVLEALVAHADAGPDLRVRVDDGARLLAARRVEHICGLAELRASVSVSQSVSAHREGNLLQRAASPVGSAAA